MHVVAGGSFPRQEVILPLEQIDWAIHSEIKKQKSKNEVNNIQNNIQITQRHNRKQLNFKHLHIQICSLFDEDWQSVLRRGLRRGTITC